MEEKVLRYFKDINGWELNPHPKGRNGEDIGGKTSDGKNVFIEIKGTLNKNGKPFTSNQNKIHMSYGVYQLMTRVTSESDIAILLLPYHQNFLNKICI